MGMMKDTYKGLKEECGVFGIYGHKDAARLTYLGLYALQHRGQESAGIAVSNRKEVNCFKGMGLFRISSGDRPSGLLKAI